MARPLPTGLSGEHFTHPLDRSAMKGLAERIAGFDQVARLLAEAEDELYLLNLADNTRLDERQGGSAYRRAAEVAGILRVPVPHVFLDTSVAAKPRTLGGRNASLVLPSALVDSLPDRALRAVIARELGHVLCGHSLLRLLAENFEHPAKLAGAIPVVGNILAGGFQLLLFEWYRSSELTADRAALLATQDLAAVQEAIIWFAGGSSRLAGELSLEAFIAQAADFEAAQAARRAKAQGILGRIGSAFSGLAIQQLLSPHPFPAVRLREITAWAASDEYARLLAGELPPPAPPPPAEDAGPSTIVAVGGFVAGLGRSAGGALRGLVSRPASGSEVDPGAPSPARPPSRDDA